MWRQQVALPLSLPLLTVTTPADGCAAARCLLPAVLKVFLILVPPILAAMARFEGKISLSEIDFVIGEWLPKHAAVVMEGLAWAADACMAARRH